MNPFFDAHTDHLVHVTAWDTASQANSESHILSRTHKVDFGPRSTPSSDLFRAPRLPVEIFFTAYLPAQQEAMSTIQIIRELTETTFTHRLILHIRIWAYEQWRRVEELLVSDGPGNDNTAGGRIRGGS